MLKTQGWATRNLLAGVGERQDHGRLVDSLTMMVPKVEVKVVSERTLDNRGKIAVPSLDPTTS